MGSVEFLEGESASPAGVAGALAAMTLSVGTPGDHRRRCRALAGGGRQVAARSGPGVDAARDDPWDLRPRGCKGQGSGGAARGRQEGRRGDRRADDDEALGAAQVGPRAGVRSWACRWTWRPPRRWWSRSGSASSGCCGSSRSWPSKADSAEPAAAPGPRTIEASEIEERAAHSAEYQAWGLADALVGGRRARRRRSPTCACASRASAWRGSATRWPGGCATRWPISLRLAEGASEADVKRGLRMPREGGRAADRRRGPQRPGASARGA